MPLAKVSSRGQVTLPSEVRRDLDIKEGDRLLIDVDLQRKIAAFRVIKNRKLSDFFKAIPVPDKWQGKKAEQESVARYLSRHTERFLKRSS